MNSTTALHKINWKSWLLVSQIQHYNLSLFLTHDRSDITQILRVQKLRLCCNCCGHRTRSDPHSSPSSPPPPPPFLMPPRLRVDSASLSHWQLLITGWPGPAALCMTASRPAQVTQSERERERGREWEREFERKVGGQARREKRRDSKRQKGQRG